MFTKIVKEVGRVKKLGHNKSVEFDLQIRANTILGDTISVNETCLTVTEFDVESFDFIVGLASRLSDKSR
ncbi:hypothetical protein V2J09_024110 [Rumex salicifolius]